MAQQNKPRQGKRAPTYSADTMVIRLIIGLALIALGVLLFIAAVARGLNDDLFTLLRTACTGLAGTLAPLLPVIPIWGGGLLIFSTQRKAPLRPFILACVLLMLIFATVTLLTFNRGGSSLMDSLRTGLRQEGISENSYPAFLSDGYRYGTGSKRADQLVMGGGLLGMLLAWFLWKALGAIGGGIVAILLSAVTFLFLIRLDVRGILARHRENTDMKAARRQQQMMQQQLQDVQWQQQAMLEEQQRQQQQQLAQQQIQQRMASAPPQADPPDPWQRMMPPGTANWNQTHGRMAPVQPMQPGQTGRQPMPPSQSPRQTAQQPIQAIPPVQPPQAGAQWPSMQPPRQAPVIGFRPAAEMQGAAPSRKAPAERKGLFSRSRDTDPAAPRRKGLFAHPEEETVPGEAVKPTRKPVSRKPAQESQPDWAASSEPLRPVVAYPDPEEDEAPTEFAEHLSADYTPPAFRSPAEDPVDGTAAGMTAGTPSAGEPAEEPRSPYQRPRNKPVRPVPEAASAPVEAWPAAPAPTAPSAASAAPAREGSFLARMQAARAAKGEAPVPAAPASRHSHKDTPSAWSQPDAGMGSASWREEAPAHPAPRNRAQRGAHSPTAPAPAQAPASANAIPQTAPQKPTASWADTPPWEPSPDYESITPPAAPVTPVLTREAPEGAWKPDLHLQPRRQLSETPDGALMETELERPYVYPSMSLLKAPQPQGGISPEEDEMRSRRLEGTLQSFKIPAKVRHITHGPAISRFELELAPGVRVSKVTDLNRNIAMNLEVKSVRIEAPIPGKSLVGVEVPNRERATVTLREVLESEPMRKATKPLVVALGKDIAGTPIVCDLAKMPHLLIAGATGSGKSVCINTIINSLLYRCSPREVRLILVDPKVVELQCYNGIPHLLVPVVSDPHKASGALAWAVGEMMDRYRRFQEAGVRAIDGYNESALEKDRMPRIVIVIDELADLMMTCKKDVEERICRLAQLARAAGIHLIVATQRPSVDVITGLIKANIPSRIAFKVSSNVDSRTILDRIGAEQLLGYGDMLYAPTGEFTPIRVQGCFLSDPEVNRITEFIRDTCPAHYDNAILEELEKLQNDADAINIPEPSDNEDYAGDGSLLMQAIEMAVNDGQVSTSLIQRRLKLGYARAGRLVDEMEKRGIISQKDGAKPRYCLISREEFEALKDSGGLE